MFHVEHSIARDVPRGTLFPRAMFHVEHLKALCVASRQPLPIVVEVRRSTPGTSYVPCRGLRPQPNVVVDVDVDVSVTRAPTSRLRLRLRLR